MTEYIDLNEVDRLIGTNLTSDRRPEVRKRRLEDALRQAGIGKVNTCHEGPAGVYAPVASIARSDLSRLQQCLAEHGEEKDSDE